MNTFYSRKADRIIAALQANLIKINNKALVDDPEEHDRLQHARWNLQEAKELCNWKIGSDGINALTQSNMKEES